MYYWLHSTYIVSSLLIRSIRPIIFIFYYETFQKIQFEKDGFGIESIMKVLGIKGSYTLQNFPDVKTIWTLAMDMTGGEYRIYSDHFGEVKQESLGV